MAWKNEVFLRLCNVVSIHFVEDLVAVWYLSVSLSGRSEAVRCASQPLSTAFTSPRCLLPTCHFRIPKDHAKTRSSCSGYGVETREVRTLRPLSCCTVLAIPCTTVTLKNVVPPSVFVLCRRKLLERAAAWNWLMFSKSREWMVLGHQVAAEPGSVETSPCCQVGDCHHVAWPKAMIYESSWINCPKIVYTQFGREKRWNMLHFFLIVFPIDSHSTKVWCWRSGAKVGPWPHRCSTLRFIERGERWSNVKRCFFSMLYFLFVDVFKAAIVMFVTCFS